MRSSFFLVLVVLLGLGSGCTSSNPARQSAAPPAPPAPEAPVLTPQAPMAPPQATPYTPPITTTRPCPPLRGASTPSVQPTAVRSAPPTWRTTDRGSRTLRIDPIGAVAVETPPPPPPPATAADLGAPPTGSLPTPLPR